MALETITREEFEKRLNAANTRRAHELQQREEQQAKAEQLLSSYERALSEIEAELENAAQRSPASPVRLRKRLTELAEKTACGVSEEEVGAELTPLSAAVQRWL